MNDFVVLFFEAIEEGSSETFENDKRTRQKRLVGQWFDGEDDEEENESENDFEIYANKKNRATNKRKSTKQSVVEPTAKKMLKKLQKTLDFVIKYRQASFLDDEEKNDESFANDFVSFFRIGHRVLSKHFMRLPTQRELPEYYETIKQPVDFNRIKVKRSNEKDLSKNFPFEEKTERKTVPKSRRTQVRRDFAV